jgi:hypothetical protein
MQKSDLTQQQKQWTPKRARIEALVQAKFTPVFFFSGMRGKAFAGMALPTITPSPPRKVSRQWWRRAQLPTGRAKWKIAGELTTSFAAR